MIRLPRFRLVLGPLFRPRFRLPVAWAAQIGAFNHVGDADPSDLRRYAQRLEGLR